MAGISSQRPRLRLHYALAGALALPFLVAYSPTQHEAELRPHMQSIYHSLSQLLTFAARGGDTQDQKSQKAVEKDFKNLADEAARIEQIASRSDKGHGFLAKELARNADLAYRKFKGGYNDQAKFFLSETVSTCFTCHTSRGSQVDSAFAAKMNEQVDLKILDPLAKARFLSLSRQFEAAALEYEKILLVDKMSIDQLVNFDPLIEYLILTLRVKDEGGRARATLKSLEKKNWPEAFRGDIATWIQAIDAIEKEKAGADRNLSSLARAEKLIAAADSLNEFPRDRSGIVHYIQASRLLQENLKAPDLSAKAKAETYYQLGRCELVIGAPLALEEANAYFREVIKLLPHSDLAQKAYRRYEENVYFGYSGSGGAQLPDEEKSTLKELRKQAF